MAAKIPTTADGTKRIELVRDQARRVLGLLDEYAGLLHNGIVEPATVERCRAIVAGAPVEFRDEYTVGLALLNVDGRISLGY